jgi:signal transduction histidine kinase
MAHPHVKDRDEVGRLAEAQAALRRVATLVARGASSTEVFEAVAREVAQVLHLPNTAVGRYDDEGTVMTLLAVCGKHPAIFKPGTRWPLDGRSMSLEVLRTGRPARVEDYTDLPGALAAAARDHGFNRVAGAPIIVDGRVWGVISTSSPDAPLPDDLEDRLEEFTELVATAIANSQAQDELARLAEEHAALHRVATIVAEGASPHDVFAAVAGEVARTLGVPIAVMLRYDADRMATVLATAGTEFGPIGARWPIEGTSLTATVFETARAARIDDYSKASGAVVETARAVGVRWGVGVPIVVDGTLWGVILAGSREPEPVPGQIEARLTKFTHLLATAVSNTQAREDLHGLVEEQAALRRVATLVAEGALPGQVFAAVTAEVARVVPADGAALTRYETDGTVTVLGGWSSSGSYRFVGRRFPMEGTVSGQILESHRPGRIENYAEQTVSTATAAARELGWRSSVGAPITVEGRLWGVLAVVSRSDRPLPPDTERRLAGFTELVATAIANAESRAELDASRARIVATADATRRRIERDLHDGAQQQLVSLALELRAAQAAAPPELGEHRAELSRVVEGLTNVLDGLREIALGIHPAILAEGGLGPALKTLARRSPIPVKLDVRAEARLPEPVEVAAYYVVSETLTNAAKYARASIVHVEVEVRDRTLRVAVRDDGIGGADPALGSGLQGLKDRAEAIGGTTSLESRPGEGTSLHVDLPLHDHP